MIEIVAFVMLSLLVLVEGLHLWIKLHPRETSAAMLEAESLYALEVRLELAQDQNKLIRARLKERIVIQAERVVASPDGSIDYLDSISRWHELWLLEKQIITDQIDNVVELRPSASAG